MAVYNTDQDILAFDAGADLSANQYNFVTLSEDNSVTVASLATARANIGILQNDPKSGQRASVSTDGISIIVAGAAITVNDLVTTNSSGRAITKPASGTYVVMGRALEAAGADGDLISMVQKPYGEFID